MFVEILTDGATWKRKAEIESIRHGSPEHSGGGSAELPKWDGINSPGLR